MAKQPRTMSVPLVAMFKLDDTLERDLARYADVAPLPKRCRVWFRRDGIMSRLKVQMRAGPGVSIIHTVEYR